MADGKELLAYIQETFTDLINNSKMLKRIGEKEDPTIFDANRYAYEVGRNMTNAFLENVTAEVLPDGKVSYSIANTIVPPMMQEEFDLVTKTTQKVITRLNQEAGLGLEGIIPGINEDRIAGLVKGISNAETLEDAWKYMKAPFQNFAVHAVDETVRKNAEFQYNAGLQPKIVRSTDGKCCEWCNKLAGVYDYPVSNPEVYQRHENCNCLVEFLPTKMRAQNVHTRTWRDL